MWDSAYLLDMFNRYAGRPDADAITPETKYKYLSEGQAKVVAEILARHPECLVQPPLSLITPDGGKTFNFGTDVNGAPLFPMGKTGIYRSLNDIPQYPLNEGWDYLNEGTQIRIPNNQSLPYPLYWRGVAPPPEITPAIQPVLMPEAARELIVIYAVKNFAQAGNLHPDLAVQMMEQWSREFIRWMLVYRTQFASGGAMSPLTSWMPDSAFRFVAYLPNT